MDRISVIVPVYNVERYIERCIESLLNQTYINLEIILVDDGSTDKSPEICDLYSKKFENLKVIHKENGGQSSARNMGLTVSTGSYIGFVDSDDWVSPIMFEYLYKILIESDSDISDIMGFYAEKPVELEQPNEELKIYEGKNILLNYLYSGIAESVGQYAVWRKLYRRELFESIRFEEGRINEDILINYQLLQKSKRLVRSNKLLYYYFQNNESTTRNGLKRKDFDLLYICKKVVEMSSDDDELRYYAEIKLSRSYFSLLAKIAYYGFKDEDIDKRRTIKELTLNLRNNFKLLMSSPIPSSRKIMIALFCIDFKLASLPLKIIRLLKS